jgi:hypothetical protein
VAVEKSGGGREEGRMLIRGVGGDRWLHADAIAPSRSRHRTQPNSKQFERFFADVCPSRGGHISKRIFQVTYKTLS